MPAEVPLARRTRPGVDGLYTFDENLYSIPWIVCTRETSERLIPWR